MSIESPYKIREAKPADLPAITELLHLVKLPPDGIDVCLDTSLVAFENDKIIGCVAYEFYGEVGMLRSLAVDPNHQSNGLGRLLYESICEDAQSSGVKAFFLMTTTAEKYFEKIGYVAIQRDDAPESIKNSVQFTSACPASATLMMKLIAN